MLAIILRLAAALSISIMMASVKLAGEAGVHFVESLFWRQVAGVPIVLIWLYFAGSISDVRTKKPMSHALRMIIGLGAMLLNYWAVTLLPIAEMTTIGFSVPIFSSVLAALILKEATGVWRWSAIGVGFVGILIVLQPGSGIFNIGALAALLGAFGMAVATILLRQMSKTETTGAIVFWFTFSSLLPAGIAIPFFAQSHSLEAWGYIALVGISGGIAQIFLTSSLRFADVATVTPMDYSMLLWSVLLGWFLFDSLPASATWIGAPIIIGAGLVIIWREHVISRRKAAAAAHAGTLESL